MSLQPRYYSDCNTMLTVCRQNPAVVAQAQHVFHSIALALEAETVQGQTAKKVVESAKRLVTMPGANVNAEAVVGQLSPEGQQAVKSYFS